MAGNTTDIELEEGSTHTSPIQRQPSLEKPSADEEFGKQIDLQALLGGNRSCSLKLDLNE